MSKEWILNSAMNRFQLNFKRNVGPTSESIRKCSPKTEKAWEEYYFTKVKPKSHIEDLGKKLYVKITEVLPAEISSITEKDCIDYMINMVIGRTYDGYQTEITTIYGQLEKRIDRKIEPASDKWDRLYNVDFYIKVKDKYIGLQIKPAGYEYIPEIIKEKEIQKRTHEKFGKEFGGKVFYVISIKENGNKIIYNKEVIEEIKQEISRLENE